MVPFKNGPLFKGTCYFFGEGVKFLKQFLASFLRHKGFASHIDIYRLHRTDIFSYIDPIKINHACRIILYQ